jgi:hypothetical protein
MIPSGHLQVSLPRTILPRLCTCANPRRFCLGRPRPDFETPEKPHESPTRSHLRNNRDHTTFSGMVLSLFTSTQSLSGKSPSSKSGSLHTLRNSLATENILGVLRSCQGFALMKGKRTPIDNGSYSSFPQATVPTGSSNTRSAALCNCTWEHTNELHRKSGWPSVSSVLLCVVLPEQHLPRMGQEPIYRCLRSST